MSTLPKPPIDWAKCGTSGNYKAHRRRGEEACDACKRANARDTADRRKRRVAA